MNKKELSIKEIERLKESFKKHTADIEPINNLISSALYINNSSLVKAYKEFFLENSSYTNLMIIASGMTKDFLKNKWGDPHFTHKANRIYNNYIIEHKGYDFVVSTEGKDLMAPGVNINSLNGNLSMQEAVISFILTFNKLLIEYGEVNTPARMKQFYERMRQKGIVQEVLKFEVEPFIQKYAQ